MTVQRAPKKEEVRDSLETSRFQEPWGGFDEDDFEWTSI
jgi:hypothetical protein